jgi:DNA-binding transcriptional LysR family regulator
LPKAFQATLVGRSPFRAVVGRGHRLARRSKVALADLIREPLLALAVKQGAAPHVEAIRKILSTRGFKPPPITAIEGPETFLATLESGIGVSLMGETGSFSRGRGLLFKPLKETGDDLMIELRIVWRRNEASSLVKNFIDLLLKVRPVKI